jgi:hypothetical protein
MRLPPATMTFADEEINIQEIGFEHQRLISKLEVKRKAVEARG